MPLAFAVASNGVPVAVPLEPAVDVQSGIAVAVVGPDHEVPLAVVPDRALVADVDRREAERPEALTGLHREDQAAVVVHDDHPVVVGSGTAGLLVALRHDDAAGDRVGLEPSGLGEGGG